MLAITSVNLWDKSFPSFTKMRPSQKQCQSPSLQCAGIRYPRSSEHPLIQSNLFTGGQVATLNGLFHGQTGHLPNMANTKASERQILNWSTSALEKTISSLFPKIFFLFNPLSSLIYSFLFAFRVTLGCDTESAGQVYFLNVFTFVFLQIQICNTCKYALQTHCDLNLWVVKHICFFSMLILSFSYNPAILQFCSICVISNIHQAGLLFRNCI